MNNKHIKQKNQIPTIDKDYNFVSCPPELKERMRVHATFLKLTNPGITAEDLAKRVCKHFNVKLVPG